MPQLPRRCRTCLSAASLGVLLVAALVSDACGGAQQAPPEDPPAASEKEKADAEEQAIAMNEESTCSIEQRSGTYKVDFQTFSSTCPAMESYEETWTGEAPSLDPDCELDVPDRWSEDKCTFERAITCTEEDGSTTRTAYTSQQKHPTGAVLTGMVSIRRYDKEGEPICQGTYSVMATRQ